jgi:cytochrome oxidase Cu insertion factor (SCO1/SenC/PrrC family)
MKRRNIGGFRFSAALAVFLATAWALLGPPSGAAQDQILPLKIKVGEKAPDFALPSANGRTVRLSDYAGHNVLIDFYRGYW